MNKLWLALPFRVYGALVLGALIRICWMPGFWAHMPKPASGAYTAHVIRTNPFSGGRMIWEARFSGLLRAYLAVRLMALWHDWHTPYADGELGINWGIHKKEAAA